MISARRRWFAAATLVAVGWLVTPQPVPVYDGLHVPDGPYRYVAPPPGAKPTAGATSAQAQTPVSKGASTNGLTVATGETGPQFSLFLPPGAMAGPDGKIEVRVEPQAPTDPPPGATVDGNVYVVSLAPHGVSLTAQSAISTLLLRSASASGNSPVMHYRADAAQAWRALKTTRGGAHGYSSSFPGPGQFALAVTAVSEDGGGVPVLSLLLGAGVVLLVGLVVVLRPRTTPG